jgi:hypothetical protein
MKMILRRRTFREKERERIKNGSTVVPQIFSVLPEKFFFDKFSKVKG